jgi:hypothetical protein
MLVQLKWVAKIRLKLLHLLKKPNKARKQGAGAVRP